MSSDEVDTSHIKDLFPDLHRTLLDIVGALDRPQSIKQCWQWQDWTLNLRCSRPLCWSGNWVRSVLFDLLIAWEGTTPL
jgi:hypothetical protein